MKPRCFSPLPAAFALIIALTQLSAWGQTSQSGKQIGTPFYRWSNVKIVAGGFITGIIPHPTLKGTMFVRTDIGGAYIYNSFLQQWTPLTDMFNAADWNLMGTESIAVDPANSMRIYLAQGTYAQSWAGNGVILRSDNLGLSFHRYNLPIQLGANEPGRYSGERLAVDPLHHNTVYLGSRNNGLWRSTDRGVTWNQVSTFPVTGPTAGHI